MYKIIDKKRKIDYDVEDIDFELMQDVFNDSLYNIFKNLQIYKYEDNYKNVSYNRCVKYLYDYVHILCSRRKNTHYKIKI